MRNQRSRTTLVVENIPQSSLSDRFVREYFTTFGPLVSVSVDVYNAQALVTFESAEDASKAYSSPEPVFNNRFVKIHFRRFTASEQQQRRDGTHHNPFQGRRNMPSQFPTHIPQLGPMGPQQSSALLNSLSNALDQNARQAARKTASLEPSLSQREQELREKIDEQKRLLEQLSLKQALKRVTAAIPASGPPTDWAVSRGTSQQPVDMDNSSTNVGSQPMESENQTKSSASHNGDQPQESGIPNSSHTDPYNVSEDAFGLGE